MVTCRQSAPGDLKQTCKISGSILYISHPCLPSLTMHELCTIWLIEFYILQQYSVVIQDTIGLIGFTREIQSHVTDNEGSANNPPPLPLPERYLNYRSSSHQ